MKRELLRIAKDDLFLCFFANSIVIAMKLQKDVEEAEKRAHAFFALALEGQKLVENQRLESDCVAKARLYGLFLRVTKGNLDLQRAQRLGDQELLAFFSTMREMTLRQCAG